MEFLFILAWMLPVLPVARRQAYVLRESQVKRGRHVYPVRTVKIPTWHVGQQRDKCRKCGGDREYHPGGPYDTIRNFKEEYRACKHFELGWEAPKNFTSKEKEYTCEGVEEVPAANTILPGILLALAVWPALLGYWGFLKGYRALDPNWDSFYKPIDLKTKNEKIELQGNRIKELEKELLNETT